MVKKIDQTDEDIRQMSSIKINPDYLLDNFFDYSNVVIRKPWGYEYLIYSNNQTAVWLLYLKPNFQTSMHAHPNKKTSIIILSGEARVETLSGNHKLNLCHGLLINKGVFHSTTVTSNNGLLVIETETPTNKRDLIRFSDKYGRRGRGYEDEKFYSKLDNKLYQSFNNSKKRYGVEKQFGDCILSLVKFSDSNHLINHTKQSKPDILVLLTGNITDGSQTCLLDTGDIISFGDLKKHHSLNPSAENESLLIKKAV
ncbi:hypothetical protein HYW46_06020 [Candidatus Daviesbacteria bacterium]|nr:hypothetical protein [Candidatus Daviesbacteria bacterium]